MRFAGRVAKAGKWWAIEVPDLGAFSQGKTKKESYAVIDKKMGVMDSFKYSAAITLNYRVKIFAIFLLTILVHLLTPPIIKFKMTETVYQTNFTLQALLGYGLITFIFIPWLKMSMAKAYLFLTCSHTQNTHANKHIIK